MRDHGPVDLDAPVVITCAVVGGDREPKNPNQPRTLDDIVREAREAVHAGAAVLHLHARDGTGAISQHPDVYARIADEIRQDRSDVVLNFTTGGSEGMGEDERLSSLAAAPDLATIDCGSMNFGPHEVFVNSRAFIWRAAGLMREHGIQPELECFDAGMLLTARELVTAGVVNSPGVVQLVLGVLGGAPAQVDTLVHLASLIPDSAHWAAFAIGHAHYPIMAATLALGGHIRTGLEDVAYLRRGVFARSNAELVRRAAQMAEAVGRPVATPAEARKILGLRG